jgi:sulfate transport system permease protein
MTEATLVTRPRPVARLARPRSEAFGRWTLRAIALLYLGLFILVPIAAIIQRGFGDGLATLADALGSFGAVNAILLTLVMATLTAAVNGVFGTLLAFILVRYRFPGRSLLSTLVDLPFAVPTLVAGLMLVALYGPRAPIGGWLEELGIQVIFAPPGILLALLFVTLPLVVRSVQPVLLELDPAEEEAAHILGASGWTTFRRVVFPALRPAIVAGALLAFSRSLGEFGAIVIVAGNIPNRTLTAPVFISQLISSTGASADGPGQAAAISTVLFSLAFVLVLATERLLARRDVAGAA